MASEHTQGTPEQANAAHPLADAFAPADRAQWLGLVEKVLKGADFDKRLVTTTSDGLRIQPLYTRRDAPAADTLGTPGAAPLTRGNRVHARGLGWEIRQLVADTDPGAANRAVLDDLAGGAGAITLRTAAAGRAGLPADALAFGQALDGVYLDMIPIALDAGEGWSEAVEALRAVWHERKVPEEMCHAAFNVDPIGALASTGSLDRPLGKALEEAARFAADPLLAAPGYTALLADGRPFHEAGGSEAQELAAMAGAFIAYLRALEQEAILPAAAVPRIAIALTADAELLLTIAKLRAARRIVWRIADACSAGEAARRVVMVVTTSERMMARRDPWVNMLRTTAACAAAAMGGASAVTVLPFTWALGQPDAFARRIARNTQVVLQEESQLGRVVDPAGGSYALDRLTDDLARKAWSILQEIEAEGGIVSALRSGLLQDQITAVAESRRTAVSTLRRELTGVSAFPRIGDDGVAVLPHAAVPVITRPAGEAITPLTRSRLAEPFEQLRDAAEGRNPRVFLVSLGPIAEHNVRTTWIKSWLAVGGIGVIEAADGYLDTAQVGRAFAESGARVAMLASSDARYAEMGEAATMALKGAGATAVWLAGRPADSMAGLSGAGVDEFVFAGSDAVAALTELQRVLGITP